MKIYIKNMVCIRCKMVVKSELKKLNHDYTYLANLFSEVKGTTIEQFFLAHKIEKVKELLVYAERFGKCVNHVIFSQNYVTDFTARGRTFVVR